jgi:Phage integrase family
METDGNNIKKLGSLIPVREAGQADPLLPEESQPKKVGVSELAKMLGVCTKTIRRHALRHTLATNLAAVGVHPVIAKAIMRHSDIGLTMGTYTHTSALAMAEAVEKLPTYGTAKGNAPGNASNLVKSSPTISLGVPLNMGVNDGKAIEKTGECPSFARGVPSCHQEEMVRGAGFEPATPSV